MMPEVRRELRADDITPAQARSIVRRMLAVWDADDDVKVAELLTSELVTNAVRHAATAIELRIEAEELTVRVEVTDNATGMPHIRDDPGVGGYGLRIVEQLATRWGFDPTPDNGKTVWFELDVRDRGAGTAAASR